MAKQQVLIIGLGQFGMALAHALTRHGTEVLAVDIDPARVQKAAPHLADAVVIDAMDESALARLRPAARDLCVCAIGETQREASIVVTAVLRQAGARRVVARATNAMHERILRLVGAHEVINPERMMGEQLAGRLAFEGVLSIVPLGDDLVIAEVSVPGPTVGRTLADLKLPRRYRLTVLALRRHEGEARKLVLPTADLQIQADDILVVAGPPGAAASFVDRS